MSNFIKRSSFNSNESKRAEYMKKLEQMAGVKKRYCKNHLTAKWGINPKTGEYYIKCAQGNLRNEACEIGE